MHPAIALPALLALAPVSVLAADGGDISVVEVAGRRVAGAYHATEASGTKTELPLRELPQAVRIMTRQSLDDLGAVRVDDALDFVGGVSRQNSFGGMWDNIAIRGIAGDVNNGPSLLQNGFAGNRGFNPPRDTANIERIEFLKGPAASLYGASDPGGTLNIVSKRPLWRDSRSLDLYAGTDDFRRAALDTTGALGAGAAYRLNAAAENRGSFRDHIASRRRLLAPAFTWKIADGTTLDYRGEALRHEAPLDRGVVAVGGRLGVIARERFLGEPADGRIRMQNVWHQLMAEHRLSEQWSLRAGLAHKDATMRGFSTEPQPSVQPDGRTLRRQRRYRDFATDDLSGQVDLAGRVRTGAVSHQVLIGFEAYRMETDMRVLRANPSAARPYAIDIFAPVYGQAQPQPAPNIDTLEQQRNRALYVQDALSLGEHWRLLAGLRHDRFDQALLNRLRSVTARQEPSATSPRVGVSYLPNASWTVYANAGRSFRPNAGVSATGDAFAPERGRALEAGVKWESADKTQGATLALYDIEKRQVLTGDPVNRDYSIAAGQIGSRGLDIDYTGQLGRQWRANASLSVIDASVERDNTLEQGARLNNIPRVNGSLLVVYENAAAPLGRFSIGGGLTYSARRLGEARTRDQAGAPFQLPAYTLAKLVAYWQVSRQVRVSLDIDNLFDRTYYSNSYQGTWVAPGSARSAVFGIQTTF